MGDWALTKSRIRPLDGARVRKAALDEAASVGHSVYVTSGDDVAQTDANVAITSEFHGVIVAIQDGKQDGVAGDIATIVTYGPVAGFTGLTPGLRQWVSATKGKLTDVKPTGAGTWTRAGGYAESAEIFFVQPGVEAPVSNS